MSCSVAHDSNDSRTLCFECGRAKRVIRLADAAVVDAVVDAPPEAVPSRLAAALSERQMAHRRAMLAFAQRLHH